MNNDDLHFRMDHSYGYDVMNVESILRNSGEILSTSTTGEIITLKYTGR